MLGEATIGSFIYLPFFVAFYFSLGYADADIEAMFARYDMDGDRVLNEIEQKKMQEDFENQKACIHVKMMKHF